MAHRTSFNASGRVCVWLAGVLLFCAMTFLAQADAVAKNSGYDPRTWSYDETRNIMLSPSDLEDDAVAEQPADWSPIPRTVVAYDGQERAGTILISTSARRLRLILGRGRALQYAVGVGREGFNWSGRDRISDKREWPDWRPPAEMMKREASKGRILPAKVEGGPENPLGARALYIGSTLYRIHGTNQPWTIGEANSSGCIRLTNDDVIDLYQRVAVGAQVVVQR
ncbi:L,D-transpeptidase [Pseudaminobacter sp. 19-2017]|uniref:L,D-transpeptidase n=1 Tax=Pseudaminobacter soli (ex Zhang et al. 2022) TaxID=2831468 RepID=A0A942I1I9_9HYPH|nr:L,D-transpeptidase [Pseudaminobacter soli]MBS3647163.1 L,D-transpeptidase [Pseudaminobacter soli]